MAFRTAWSPVYGEYWPRESFRSWECEASSHRFSIKGAGPQKATRGRARTPTVPQLWDQTQPKNLRKLRKLLSIAPAKLPQLGGFFIAAFELEYHALDVSVVLVPPQEL
jgi:hypothetical protein